MGRCDQGRDAPAYPVARAEEGVASLARPTRPEPDTLRAPMAPATAAGVLGGPTGSGQVDARGERPVEVRVGLRDAGVDDGDGHVAAPGERPRPFHPDLGDDRGAVGMSASRPSSQLAIALS